uniref:F-box domain-containing protein n=1 Tax=Anopheles atroparvus TaxID=41427 RepID=A0A182JCE4_ANOAO
MRLVIMNKDYIFGYLPLEDQKNARLICRQWNQHLSSPRYYKNTKLQLAAGNKYLVYDDLLRAAGQRKIHCIELTELTSTASEEEKRDITFLLYMNFNIDSSREPPTIS